MIDIYKKFSNIINVKSSKNERDIVYFEIWRNCDNKGEFVPQTAVVGQ